MWLFAMAMIDLLSPRYQTEPCVPTMASTLFAEMVSTSKTAAFNNQVKRECHDFSPYYTKYDYLHTLQNKSCALYYVITYANYSAFVRTIEPLVCDESHDGACGGIALHVLDCL